MRENNTILGTARKIEKRIVIDPITRGSGHLRVEVEISSGKVTNAWISAQMFRGIEIMLKGRDPRDAQHFTNRFCGITTYASALSSVRAIEQAVGIEIPENARIIRNMLHGVQYQYECVYQFFNLQILDWIDVVSALKADPEGTGNLADSINMGGKGGSVYYRDVKTRLQTFFDSGQLGPFSNAYWGHSTYRLTPEGNLMLVAKYLEALEINSKICQAHAIFGGKNPHPQALVVGGVTCIADLTADRIAEFLFLTRKSKEFIDLVCMPSVVYIAKHYGDYCSLGGTTNFLSWGEFPSDSLEPETFYMPRGIITNRDLSGLEMAYENKVTEEVTRSWYEDGPGQHPYDGQTKPIKEDPEYRPDSGKYSWLKAPRYDGSACEVGPLARVLIAYAEGHKDIKPLVDSAIEEVGMPRSGLFSIMGRTISRVVETSVVSNAMEGWISQLIKNIKNNDTKTYTSYEMPQSALGVGLNESPSGSLGHWVKIENGKLQLYQAVSPSTWNFSPRDDVGKLGPVEEALIGIPIADHKQLLEILRTVHSFSLRVSCGVH